MQNRPVFNFSFCETPRSAFEEDGSEDRYIDELRSAIAEADLPSELKDYDADDFFPDVTPDFVASSFFGEAKYSEDMSYCVLPDLPRITLLPNLELNDKGQVYECCNCGEIGCEVSAYVCTVCKNTACTACIGSKGLDFCLCKQCTNNAAAAFVLLNEAKFNLHHPDVPHILKQFGKLSRNGTYKVLGGEQFLNEINDRYKI